MVDPDTATSPSGANSQAKLEEILAAETFKKLPATLQKKLTSFLKRPMAVPFKLIGNFGYLGLDLGAWCFADESRNQITMMSLYSKEIGWSDTASQNRETVKNILFHVNEGRRFYIHVGCSTHPWFDLHSKQLWENTVLQQIEELFMTIKLCGDEDLEGWLRHRYYGRPSCSSLPEMRSLKRLNICIVKKPTKKKSIGEVSDMQYASEVVYWLLARTRAQVEVKGAVPLHFKTPKQGPKVWLAPEAIDKLIEKNNYIKGKAVRWTSISKIDNNEPALFAEIRSIFRR